jgi:hypothetical protein
MSVAAGGGSHGRSGAVKVRNTRVTDLDAGTVPCYVGRVNPPFRGAARP